MNWFDEFRKAYEDAPSQNNEGWVPDRAGFKAGFSSAWRILEAETAALKSEVERLKEALELISTPKRADGTYNRSREACEQIAREALRRSAPNPDKPGSGTCEHETYCQECVEEAFLEASKRLGWDSAAPKSHQSAPSELFKLWVWSCGIDHGSFFLNKQENEPLICPCGKPAMKYEDYRQSRGS